MNKKREDSVIVKCLKEYIEGKTYQQIFQENGISPSTLVVWVKRAGVKRNNKHDWSNIASQL